MRAWWRDIERFDPRPTVIERRVDGYQYDLVCREEYRKPWDCILLDESHKIKNRIHQISKFTLNLSLKSKYRYILTGNA